MLLGLAQCQLPCCGPGPRAAAHLMAMANTVAADRSTPRLHGLFKTRLDKHSDLNSLNSLGVSFPQASPGNPFSVFASVRVVVP